MKNKMDMLMENINRSKEYNKKRNIFYYANERFPFGLKILKGIEGGLELEENHIKYLCTNIIECYRSVFIENNQYINFDDNLYNSIYQVYYEYFNSINLKGLSRETIEKYTEDYQKKLVSTFSEIDEIRVLDNNKKIIDKIPCSEYSAKHQMSVLNLKCESLKEPLIDIGSGENGNLVEYLRSKGIEAFGIDRKINNIKEYLMESSWFQYEFKKETYGTIVAHMSFTNHFKREHLKKNSDHISYAKKYMEILQSLKPYGKFYYAPNLDFIENLLPKDEYEVKNYKIQTNYMVTKCIDDNIMGTIITKK